MQGSDEIVKSALGLPERERAEVARRILDSLDAGHNADVEAAWATEVAKRIRDLSNGRATSVPAAEALDRARARLSSPH